MKFYDIPKFPRGSYRVGVELAYFKEQLARWNRDLEDLPNYRLIMEPEWQRGRVWSEEQQIAYMEYFLKGGKTGRDLWFNCSSWSSNYSTPIYCLDGLQRITAALAFLDGKIPVFGHYFDEFEDKPREEFYFNMLEVKNKRELLTVYYDFNSGGTPHNPKELERISKMIEKTDPSETL